MDNTPFTQHLNYLNKGTLADELTECMSEVVKAVRDSGKKGSVTVTLNVNSVKGSEDQVSITSSVKHLAPQLDRPATIMFSTADGDLLRDDPDKLQMTLKSIESQPVSIKKIS
jgi:hypothetical protein